MFIIILNLCKLWLLYCLITNLLFYWNFHKLLITWRATIKLINNFNILRSRWFKSACSPKDIVLNLFSVITLVILLRIVWLLLMMRMYVMNLLSVVTLGWWILWGIVIFLTERNTENIKVIILEKVFIWRRSNHWFFIFHLFCKFNVSLCFLNSFFSANNSFLHF